MVAGVLAVRLARPQRISVTRMWFAPLVLCLLTAFVIYANNTVNPAPPAEIALGLIVGGLAGIPFGMLRGRHTDVHRTDRKGVMSLGSSWVTVGIFAGAFALRYGIRMIMPHRGSLSAVIGDGLLAFAIAFIATSYLVIIRKYEELVKA